RRRRARTGPRRRRAQWKSRAGSAVERAFLLRFCEEPQPDAAARPRQAWGRNEDFAPARKEASRAKELTLWQAGATRLRRGKRGCAADGRRTSNNGRLTAAEPPAAIWHWVKRGTARRVERG